MRLSINALLGWIIKIVEIVDNYYLLLYGKQTVHKILVAGGAGFIGFGNDGVCIFEYIASASTGKIE